MSRRKFATVVAAVLAAGGVAAVLLDPETAVAPPVQAGGLAAVEQRAGAPRDVIVRFEEGTPGSERARVRRAANVDLRRSLPVDGMQLVRPQGTGSVRAAAAALSRAPDVLYAEPDHARYALAVPDDRFFGLQWGLDNRGQPIGGTPGTADVDIDAPEAWDRTTGSADVVVGVVDTGIDASHPDLAPNLWTNPDETDNGRDDDGNGLVDDLHGWDFAGDDADPADGHGHGTHVAGTVGARGNDSVGVTGVAWRTSLMPLRVLGDDGAGHVSDLVAGYAYAGRRNIRIVNASLGGNDFSRAERDAIAAARNTLFVTAAGNEGVDNDVTPSYPCNHDLPNVICVAAIDSSGALPGFSNHGARTVDLAAPGVAIASTYLGGTWQFLDGTSMAAPHVAGVAALAWSVAPDADVARVREAILASAVAQAGLEGRTVTGGIVNAQRVVERLAPSAPASSATATPVPAAPVAPGTEPAPAPAVAPGVAPDRTKPRLSLSAGRNLRLRTLLVRGARLTAGCSEACTLRLELRAPRAAAVRLRLARRSVAVLARARSGLARAGRRTLTARPGRRARARLRRAHTLRLELRVSATDRAGNRTTRSQTISVRR